MPQDYAQAAAWYRKAAEQGVAQTQCILGFSYAEGQGVPQDDAQAAAWYRKAAEQGFAGAQHNLGLMYAEGQGVQEDYVEGYKWLNLAASRASSEKKRYAETLDVVAKTMTPAQLAAAQKLAREWLAAFEKRGGK
ncbi:MAG: Secretory immunoglobulin A-binding protein EsiB [Nitrospira sp.]|nr:Secretory immunoglobulin A-binding protein EsiB [Nitrospira sp.]